jgi:hypothetical protein
MAHRDLGGGMLLPIHWALFDLGLHPWHLPAEVLLAQAEAAGVELALPRIGERVTPAGPPPRDPWWRELR